MNGFNLLGLGDREKGWSFLGIDIKTGRLITFRKFHYFENGKSIDGKYKRVKNDSLLSTDALMIADLCKADYKKYKEMKKEAKNNGNKQERIQKNF